MKGPKPKNPINLTSEQEHVLQTLVNARNSLQGKVVRACILLPAFDRPEWSNQQTAKEARCTDWTFHITLCYERKGAV
jgi:hypothetical protein